MSLSKIGSAARALFARRSGKRAAQTLAPDTGEYMRTGGNSLFTIRDPVTGYEQERQPGALTYSEMEEMASEAQVAACLWVIKLPIYAIDWRISCEDEANTEIPSFVESALRRIWQPLVRNTFSALDYGWSFQEKRWEQRDGRWVWRPPLSVHPKELKILRDGNDFAGVKQTGQAGKSPPLVRAEKCFVYSHDMPFGNLYGRPRTWGAYKACWMKKHILRFAGVFYERTAQPLVEGRAPETVTTRIGGTPKQVDGLNFILQNVLQKLSAGQNLYALPSGRDSDGNYEWDVVLKEVQKSGADYIAFLNYLDVMISRGIFVPDLAAFQNAQVGSRALGEAHGDVFWQSQLGLIDDFKGHIDLFLLPQIITYNFGADAPRCYWEHQPLSPSTVAWLKQLVMLMVRGNVVRPDLQELEDRLGVSLKEAGKRDMPIPPGTQQQRDRWGQVEVTPKKKVADIEQGPPKKIEAEQREFAASTW